MRNAAFTSYSSFGMTAFLFDLDGTLYVGEVAIPGAADAVRALAERGVAYRYVTNTTRMSRRALAVRLAALGFPAPEEALFTPALAAARWLRERGLRRVALYVPEAAHEDFATLERDDIQPEAVVVGDLGEGWTFEALNRAFAHLMRGAALVALQKNRYWLTPAGLTLDAGPFVAALEYAAAREAVVVGKPSADFFRLAADSLGVSPRTAIMIGDDVEADVAGAQDAGLRGALVRTGKYRDDELRRSGVRPDAILDSAADVLDLL
jgi:phospholysine phosphohistidine inorganic pyrophosphate phosphatase